MTPLRTVASMRPPVVLAAWLLVVLAAKFLWPLLAFDLPLGYDVGIYRYLFVHHAQGFPPFVIAPMDAWALEHPIGLFIFTSPLIRLGVPVEWFLGWIWNLTAALLVVCFAEIVRREYGSYAAIGTLVAGILSLPYYDGFTAMYWKTYVALGFCVLALHLLHRRSLWSVVPAFFTIITHHQTGLLLLLTVGAWWILQTQKRWKEKEFQRAAGLAMLMLLLVFLVYLPVGGTDFLKRIIPLLLHRGDETVGGNFPSALFYVRTNGILLGFGAFGFLLSAKKRLTLWHWAVLWSSAFVLLRLIFYRRFFLQLDFFLFPFVGIGLAHLWKRCKTFSTRIPIVLLLVVQLLLVFQVMWQRTPQIDQRTFELIQRLPQQVPTDALVVTLENVSTPWVVGWLPDHPVGGPGLFNVGWTFSQWEQFLFGTHEERVVLLKSLPPNTQLLVTPFFLQYYGQSIAPFLHDSCFKITPGLPLLTITCVSQ